MRGGRLVVVAMIAAAGVCLAAQDRAAPGGTVAGVVRYAGGEAIADVRVSLIVRGDPVAVTTRTGPDGSYRFDAVPAGQYQLSASHPGAVARNITVTPGGDLKGLDFSIPNGSLRVVIGRIVMNEASKAQPVPTRIGIGVMRRDGTLAVPLRPGDQRLVVRLPSGYFLDSAAHGAATVYSTQSDGRRLSAGAFSITVPPEPAVIPELLITLGSFAVKTR